MTTAISTHRFLQLNEVVDACEAKARVHFRCATKADKIGNRGAATYFRARATKFLRVAARAALKAGM